MTTRTPTTGLSDYLSFSDRVCPQCAGDLMRTSRRSIDRLTSLFIPVHRYRCCRFSCQWQGNLRIPGKAQGLVPDPMGAKRRVSRLPVSFVVNIVLAVTGVVLVVAVSVTESFQGREVEISDISVSQTMRSTRLAGSADKTEPAAKSRANVN